MTPRPYTNPYIAGVALGLVLLACFALAGQGLGASGAFAGAASSAAAAMAADQTATNAYFSSYLGNGSPWTSWIAIEVLGVLVGAAASALISGRFKFAVERAPSVNRTSRLTAALAGGAVMGLGAVLARGCTSGQALTGGSLLSVGSWAFMIAVFASGYASAFFLRRLWR